MTKEEAVLLLKKGGVEVFNAYRQANTQWIPDFSGADLSSCELFDFYEPANLENAILCGTVLSDKESFQQGKARLKGAIIDANTSGISLDKLRRLGAQFSTVEQISKRKEASLQIFISYAWANSDVVSAIDYWLRLKDLDTKIDKRDFFAGSRIQEEILRMMQDSGVVLLFHSFESKDKPWVQFERELVADLQMTAKTEGRVPPRIIYVVIDDTPLPGVTEKNKIAIMAKGKRFELVCEEIYHHILQLPRAGEEIDLSQWQDFVF